MPPHGKWCVAARLRGAEQPGKLASKLPLALAAL